MNLVIILSLAVALITFVSLLAVSNPNDGSTTEGMADYGVSNQGCLGGCLMLPMILIVRPFEFLFSAFGTVASANDEAKRRSIRNKAIGSLIVGLIFGVLFFVFVLN
ncbi:hypothetical protein [Adlercreutzia agrestimuris]|uniref:hypothetical protein n=1 Tax=Adlercreutzia agrestimuris TaxID=2941324 RepID=UPI002040E6AD|nr:hypothetical protein [Adlercreutzia agrestimuris]